MRCPVCERQFQLADSTAPPFCSDRCRLIDLGRWLGEGYALPADPTDESGEESARPDDRESHVD